MDKGTWHFTVISLLVLIIVLIVGLAAFVSWRIHRMRHPIIVQVPPPDTVEHLNKGLSEVIDEQMRTRSHVSNVVDSIHADIEFRKQRERAIDKIIRKIAKSFGISTDEID